MSLQWLIALGVASLLTACGQNARSGASKGPAPSFVTADIQAGIETHIENESRLGGGLFRLKHGDQELQMKLVRVHTEYLAKLGPERHFACVDLADDKGDVYDVDFFITGKPGHMSVTETTVHKLNGQPYYMWEQDNEKNWHRIPVERASEMDFGVIRGTDSFHFTYAGVLPDLDGPARLWIPVPTTDRFQNVELLSLHAPGRQTFTQDLDHGNRILVLDLGPGDGGKPIDIRYAVQRFEKSAYSAPSPEARDLSAERLVPSDPVFKKTAQEVLQGKKGELVRARALYDHVIDRMRYAKSGEGWGKGDAVYACDSRSGNCTDFHAYFIALARSVGIPARFAIGVGVPSERNDGGIDGYHCWAEFYADGKWWPVDISEADKYSALATYYFGHHPANRLELSRGRDLNVDPAPASGPINFLAYPLLEVAGKPVKVPVQFSFERTTVRGPL